MAVSLPLWSEVQWPVTRPLQLGLIEGTDKHVGPMIGSVVRGDNADLMAAVAPLYLTGSVLDVTYGRGMWWRRFKPEPFLGHDLATDGVDFRALPHTSGEYDTVCFDPPYITQGGTSARDVKSVRFRKSYGLTESINQRDLDQLFTDGLTECARVAGRFVLVKCMDYTNAEELHLGHVKALNAATDLGLYCHDLIVHDRGRAGPGGANVSVQQRARRTHSYLLVLAHKRRRANTKDGDAA